MNFISCLIIRRLVLIAASMLVTGLLLLLLSQGLASFYSGLLMQLQLFVAFSLILSSPLMMLIGFTLSVLPGSRERLEQCIR